MSRPQRRMIQFLWLAVIGYLVLVVLAAVCQRQLIYVPRQLSPAQAETTAVSRGFVPFRNPAREFIGWKLAATNAPAASVLIFHGNAGCALDREYLAAPIRAASPVEVIVVEYPGYGVRAGAPDRDSILATAEAALGALPTNRPVYLVSESLGAGPAAHLARKFPARIAGLVMFVPYDDFGKVAQSAMPFLPARWLLRDRFLPADWLKDFRGPIQFVLAGADEVIPTKRGQALYDTYAGTKRLQVVPGAGHNEVASQSPDWWREIFSYLEQHRRADAGQR